jgi:hypothetical protein
LVFGRSPDYPSGRRLFRRVVLAAVLGCSSAALANGHGPVYGLAPPTLGEGAFSLDVAAMARFAGPDVDSSFRAMLTYGITSDLQVSASLPMPLYMKGDLQPVRMMAMLPEPIAAEVMLGWRFHRQEPAVGARFESTLFLAFDYPVEAQPPGTPIVPSLMGALVTGYASRSVYAWLGVLYNRSMTASDARYHQGDQAMASLVLGYRPPFLERDAPHPDWRFFVEVIGEYTFPDEALGQTVANTGGGRVLVGPTVLGLFGAWGISGGPLFPVYSSLNGNQPADIVRLAIIFTYWWF